MRLSHLIAGGEALAILALLIVLLRAPESPADLQAVELGGHSSPAAAEPGEIAVDDPEAGTPAPGTRTDAAPGPAAVDGPAILFGTIRDTTGRWPGSASVLLQRPGRPQRYLDVDARLGTWCHRVDEAGAGRLLVRARGCLPATRELELGRVRGRQRCDFVLEPAPRVEVYVRTPAGEAIRDAVQGSPLEGRLRVDLRASIELAGDAEPAVEGLPLARWIRAGRGEDKALHAPGWMGSLQLALRPPCEALLRLRGHELARQRLRAGQAELVFELAPEQLLGALGVLRFRPVDAETKAIVDEVEIDGGIARFDYRKRSGGVIECQLTPGPQRVSVFAVGHATETLQVDLRPGAVLDLGDLEFGKPAPGWSLLVRDSSGAPRVATVCVFKRHTRGQHTGPWIGGSNESNNQGFYPLRNQVAGRTYVAVAETEGGDPRQMGWLVFTLEGPPRQLELRMRETRSFQLATRFRDSRDRVLTVATAEGVPILHRGLGSQADLWQSLPPGRYTVRVHGRDGFELERPLLVGQSTERLILR